MKYETAQGIAIIGGLAWIILVLLCGVIYAWAIVQGMVPVEDEEMSVRDRIRYEQMIQ